MRVKSQYGDGTLVWVGVDQSAHKVTYRILLDHTTDFKNCESLEIKCPKNGGWLKFGPIHPEESCPNHLCLYQVNLLVGTVKNIYYTLAHNERDAAKLAKQKLKDPNPTVECVKLLAKADPILEPSAKP
jgi:hypothetical protein